MVFLFKYNQDENQFGSQELRFLVADDYEQLFLTDVELAALPASSFIETDIYELGSVKQDLNTDEGSYAIDELAFSINHANCHTDDELKALWFVLDAADNSTPRFCAFFFGNDPTDIANLLLVGKIQSKFSADDITWDGSGYNININPLREYKFSALTFDLSILDEVKFRTKILDKYGNVVDNVHTRLAASDWAKVKTVVGGANNWRLNYGTAEPNPLYYKEYTTHLASLYDIIAMFLIEANAIINDRIGTSINFSLTASNLGFKTKPISYVLMDRSNYGSNEKQPYSAIAEANIGTSAPLLEMKLDSFPADSTYSNPFIHKGMISSDTMLSIDKNNEDIVNNEQQYDFMATDNMTDFLFALAKSFACYIRIGYTTNSNITIKFVPMSGIPDATSTYIIGAKQAALDTTSILTKGADQFFGQSTKYTTDGGDFCPNISRGSRDLEVSAALKAATIARKDKENKKDTQYERLLLASGIPLQYISRVNNYGNYRNELYPFNINDFNFLWAPDVLQDVRTDTFPLELREHVLINIYAKTTSTQADGVGSVQETYLGVDAAVWRPIHKIVVEEDGVDVEYDTLAEYVSAKQARDRSYYETEYSLTIPFWNAFSSTTDATGASWKNAKIGAKIPLSEKVMRYEAKYLLDSLTFVPNLATATYSAGHGFLGGETVIISDTETSFLNGEFIVIYISPTVFNFTIVNPTVTGIAGLLSKFAAKDKWSEVTSTRTYVIVSIERQLSYPETKIKLHNLSRFAYGTWSGDPANISGQIVASPPTAPTTSGVPVYTEGEANSILTEGDFVQLLANGKYQKAQSDNTYFGRTIGIATQDATSGDTIIIQTSGSFTSANYNFTDLTNPQIYVRTSTGLNVTETLLEKIRINEDMVIIGGMKLNNNTIMIDIIERSYYV